MQYIFVASAALLSAVASAADITVTVGPDLKFHPDTITASKGDTVSFKIGSDHNVQSGDFGSPCVNSNGFSSGGSFNGNGFNPKVFRVEINDTNAIYGFCGEEGHCQAGMTFTINGPTSGDTGDAYRKAATGTSDSTPFRSVRGGQFVAPGSSSGGSGSGSSSSSASSSASASSSSESSSAAASSKPSSPAVTPEATPSSTKTILTTASSAAGAASPSGGSAGTTGLAGGATKSSSAPIETFTGAAVPGQNGREGFATAAVMFFASVMAWFL